MGQHRARGFAPDAYGHERAHLIGLVVLTGVVYVGRALWRMLDEPQSPEPLATER